MEQADRALHRLRNAALGDLPHRGMTANFDAAAVARLDRLYGSPQILEQRRRFRAALAPQPGERGLDVGCGAGHLTCELAKDVAPGGRITAIDSSEDAIAACKARSERE